MLVTRRVVLVIGLLLVAAVWLLVSSGSGAEGSPPTTQFPVRLNDAKPPKKLQCEPGRDYHHELAGHNWDSWQTQPHSPKQSYLPDGRPRVPCEPYWKTGTGGPACPALPWTRAARNRTAQAHCEGVLVNDWARGDSLPRAASRREGWPHLPPDHPANADKLLPPQSPFPLGHPLVWRNGRVMTTHLSTAQLMTLGQHGVSDQTDSFAVNLGANDGATSDPVAELFHQGWRGLAVESEFTHCGKLRASVAGRNVTVLCPEPATPDTVVGQLQRAGASLGLDYVKIDIDSYDCDVLEAMLRAGYRPKVLQMETGTMPPPLRFAAHFVPGGRYSRPHAQTFQAFGCSLSYVLDLLEDATPGYKLLEAGLDSVFVRNDVVAASADIRALVQDDPLTAYVNGFWRWPWRRELHVWEIASEHWFQLKSDESRLAALAEHMECVETCFHSREQPFRYTLSLNKGTSRGKHPTNVPPQPHVYFATAAVAGADGGESAPPNHRSSWRLRR